MKNKLIKGIEFEDKERCIKMVADLANVNYVGDTTESVNTLSGKYMKVLNLFPAGVI